ncbi:MAG TPA: hypothetical protein VM536_07590 [Chloroflexia bacterium]|nr:hypothetical protein [Chloroflexia bacterium]
MIVTLEEGDDQTVTFGNFCLVGSGGVTLDFWSNRNGQALFTSDDRTFLINQNLRNANGTNFDPASYAAFRTWILSTTATNMAYMLSAQYEAMQLNVRHGFVLANSYYIPAGMTVQQLLDAANTTLGRTVSRSRPARPGRTRSR